MRFIKYVIRRFVYLALFGLFFTIGKSMIFATGTPTPENYVLFTLGVGFITSEVMRKSKSR